jgi:hypothetical protein
MLQWGILHNVRFNRFFFVFVSNLEGRFNSNMTAIAHEADK